MPELPEVETIRLQLQSLIIRKQIKHIDIFAGKSFIGDKNLLGDSKIIDIRRFGKILVIDLDNGLSLAVHLKMSGQIIYREHGTENREQKGYHDKYTRVIINFSGGSAMFFNDMRRFGWMRILKNQESGIMNYELKLETVRDLRKRLGADTLNELDGDTFINILKSSKRPVKLVLMDQEKIAGVGNIYANEALFRSGIYPKMAASQIRRIKLKGLFHNLQAVLKMGIRYGGTTSNLYRNAYGEKGEVQNYLRVYGKKGEACPNKCGGKIVRIKLGGRGTFYCPKCQRN